MASNSLVTSLRKKKGKGRRKREGNDKKQDERKKEIPSAMPQDSAFHPALFNSSGKDTRDVENSCG